MVQVNDQENMGRDSVEKIAKEWDLSETETKAGINTRPPVQVTG